MNSIMSRQDVFKISCSFNKLKAQIFQNFLPFEKEQRRGNVRLFQERKLDRRTYETQKEHTNILSFLRFDDLMPVSQA